MISTPTCMMNFNGYSIFEKENYFFSQKYCINIGNIEHYKINPLNIRIIEKIGSP